MYKFKRFFKWLVICMAGFVVVFFLARNVILHKVFERMAGKMKEKYGTEVSVSELHFSGVSGIVVTKLAVVPEHSDTLLTVDSLYVCPSLFRLLIGKARIHEAVARNISLSVVRKKGFSNVDRFFKKSEPDSTGKHAGRNFAQSLNRVATGTFDLFPQQMNLQNISVRYQRDDDIEKVMIPFVTATEEAIESSILNLRDSSQWNLSGNFSQRKRTCDFKIFPGDTVPTDLPFLQTLFSVKCRFDTLHVMLSKYDYSGGQAGFSGNVSTDRFFLQHPKISDEPVGVDHADFSFSFRATKNSFSLDTTSILELNKILLHPSFEITNDEKKVYKIGMETERLSANDFFNSLPSGIFDEVNGVKADGTLQYSLGFRMDSSQPDSLFFNSSMKKESFRLRNPGKENLLKMNEEFLFSVFEQEKFVRSFLVGPSNPGFTPLLQIAPSFKNAVMTSEDGSFFFHNGFNEDAFRKSIAANYQAGKFVRGGSTITMQLVKNVFLNRHKTIARKAEEALIVWLIESNHLCSKERMFEVYLNIIELGPGIYGIGEASRFYFNKKPSELNLAESVFLASLLPRPKWFKYSFDETGNLKPYFAGYYRVVANFLLKKNLVTQEEYDHLEPRVELKGPAKNLVSPADSLPALEEEKETD
ncbi:MAG: transglycosylase domain-containing protein [Bacteroidetes bacterium]|nr:transglycosylase domain-containing protein [Bacteroidota bacterium]